MSSPGLPPDIDAFEATVREHDRRWKLYNRGGSDCLGPVTAERLTLSAKHVEDVRRRLADTLDEQTARIAELKAQLALAIPAQRFAGAMIDAMLEREGTMQDELPWIAGGLDWMASQIHVSLAFWNDDADFIITPAGEAALAAWRESQQEASDG